MKKFLIAAVDRLNGHQVAGFGTSATLKRLGLMSDSEPSSDISAWPAYVAD